MHFIHLFSILLPVCFNKFSVQCSFRCYVDVTRSAEAIILAYAQRRPNK